MSGKTLFSWLHLSDIHGRQRKPQTAHAAIDQALVWEKLVSDVLACIQNRIVPRPDALLITGDIAFSGDRAEYAEVGRKLRLFLYLLGLPESAVYFVPGNHDVQRNVGKTDPEFAFALDGQRAAGAKSFESYYESCSARLNARFENYLEFVRSFSERRARLFWSDSIVRQRLRIRIAGLNTALLSDDDDDFSRLQIGGRQVEELLSPGQEEFVIVLSHHPFDGWLRDGEAVRRKIESRSCVHLHGHIHLQGAQLNRLAGGSSAIRISAGAVHADEHEAVAHAYSFGSVGVDATPGMFVQIWPRRWSAAHDHFRIDADNSDPLHRSTRFRLPELDSKRLMAEERKPWNDHPHSDSINVFDIDELDKISGVVDTESRRRRQVVHEFIGLIADRCKYLFNIDQNQLDLHPLFSDLQRTLDSLVAGIVLNEEQGTLRRAGTRHAILRTETLRHILVAVDPDKLTQVCQKIGAGAASDLITNVLEKRNFVPVSAPAFVALWDYWDRTGGWGQLSLVDDDGGGDRWLMRISNNFLQPEPATQKAAAEVDGTELSGFWCGYIHGFLGEALPRIRRMMLSSANSALQQTFLPAFVEVAEVKCVRDDTTGGDLFEISFKKEALSPLINRLARARKWFLEGSREGQEIATMSAAEAIHEAISIAPGQIDAMLAAIGPQSPGRVVRFASIKANPDDRESPTRLYKRGRPAEWVEDARWVIQELTRAADAATPRN